MASNKDNSQGPQIQKDFNIRIELDIKPACELPDEHRWDSKTLVAYLQVWLNTDPPRFTLLFYGEEESENEMKIRLGKYENYIRANLGEALLWTVWEVAEEAWLFNNPKVDLNAQIASSLDLQATGTRYTAPSIKTWFQQQVADHAIRKQMRLHGTETVHTGHCKIKPELRFSPEEIRQARRLMAKCEAACREVRNAIRLGKPESEWRELGKQLKIRFDYLLDALAEEREENDRMTKSGRNYKGKFKWQPKMVAYVLAIMSSGFRSERRVAVFQWREVKEAIEGYKGNGPDSDDDYDL